MTDGPCGEDGGCATVPGCVCPFTGTTGGGGHQDHPTGGNTPSSADAGRSTAPTHNPLDLPRLEMTDDEWDAWCDTQGMAPTHNPPV